MYKTVSFSDSYKMAFNLHEKAQIRSNFTGLVLQYLHSTGFIELSKKKLLPLLMMYKDGGNLSRREEISRTE